MDFGFVGFGSIEAHKDVVRAERRGFSHAWLYDSQMLTSDVYAALALGAGLRDAGMMPGQDFDLVAKQTSSVLDHTTPAIDTIFEDLTATGHTLASILVRRINEEPIDTLQSIRMPELRFRTQHPPAAAAGQ